MVSTPPTLLRCSYPFCQRYHYTVRQNESQLDFVSGGVKGGLMYGINQRNTAANQVGQKYGTDHQSNADGSK